MTALATRRTERQHVIHMLALYADELPGASRDRLAGAYAQLCAELRALAGGDQDDDLGQHIQSLEPAEWLEIIRAQGLLDQELTTKALRETSSLRSQVRRLVASTGGGIYLADGSYACPFCWGNVSEEAGAPLGAPFLLGHQDNCVWLEAWRAEFAERWEEAKRD